MKDIKIQQTKGIYGTTYFWEAEDNSKRIAVQRGPESLLTEKDCINILKERVQEYLND
jgi:hypothetical protein